MNLMKDKKSLLKFLIDTMEKSNKYTQGLRGMKDRGFSQDGMIENLVKVTAMQSEQIKHLALIALIYAQDDKFSSAVAMMAMKMGGDGREVLRAMMDAKFGRK